MAMEFVELKKGVFGERFWLKSICNLEGSDFTLEHAWWMLKDKPKLLAHFIEKCSKRTKLSATNEYSSSSNPNTPIEIYEIDTPSWIPHPRRILQKQKTRKSYK